MDSGRDMNKKVWRKKKIFCKYNLNLN